MCERPSVFLLEPKSILLDLLKRTRELLDLSLHLIEYERLDQLLSQRPTTPYSLRQSCQLNHSLRNDLDRYLHRLYRSCRLTKTHLRALHAARLTGSKDYIVLDDEVVQSINLFKSRLNQIGKEFRWIEKVKKIGPTDQLIHRRYQSQRTIHHSQTKESFIFLPETKLAQNNNSFIGDDYRLIFISFGKIAQFSRFLLEHFYGVHQVRDSHLLQPMFINIIRYLLLIVHHWKQRLSSPLPPQCKIAIHSEETIINMNDSNEDEHESLKFDEEEFYRLANLERDIEK